MTLSANRLHNYCSWNRGALFVNHDALVNVNSLLVKAIHY